MERDADEAIIFRVRVIFAVDLSFSTILVALDIPVLSAKQCQEHSRNSSARQRLATGAKSL